MLVSVIIPVYNVADYIERTVQSVLAQDFQGEFEVVCVDDGSTDGSLALLEQLAARDARVRVFHQENAGVSAARNCGISHAAGEYVVFLDGDDLLSPNALTTLFTHFSSDTVLVSADFFEVSSYDVSFAPGPYKNEKITSREKVVRLLGGKCNISSCAKMFLRDKIGTSLFPVGKKGNEDKYFLSSYLLNNEGSVIEVAAPIYAYYTRLGSASRTFSLSQITDCWLLAKEIEKDVSEKAPDLLPLAKYNRVVTGLAVLKHMIRACAEKECKAEMAAVKTEVLAIAKSLSKNELGAYRREVAMLHIGTPLYALCVKLVSYIRKKKK